MISEITEHREKRTRLWAPIRWWPYRGLVALWMTAACLVALPARAQSLRQPPSPQRLVPASSSNFTRTDIRGNPWQIDSYGRLNAGRNNDLNSSMYLYVNGNRFSSPQSRMMTADGSEYVLGRQVSNLQVTRRIKLDMKNSAARYVEMFYNPGSQAVNVSVSIRSNLGNNQAQVIMTDTGTLNAVSLGKRDSGLVAVGRPGGSQGTVVFHLAGPRSKIKPALKISNRMQFVFDYTFKVEAGKTASLLHGAALHGPQAVPDAKATAAMLKPFHARNWIRDLPKDVRRSIVNLGGFGFGGFGSGESLASLESLGIERKAVDVVALGEQTRLPGTASCGRLAVETRYGAAEVPFEKVAAVVGQKNRSRKPRVFLRDGRVFGGKITTEDFRFTMNSGLQLELTIDKLDRLVMRADKLDDKPETDVVVMLETVDGDRLALVRSQQQRLGITTPWGQRRILLEEVRRLVAAEEGIGHRLVLRDGSRLFAFLDEAALSLTTLAFGPHEFAPVEIRSLICTGPKSSEEDDPTDVAVPHLVLAGQNVLVGQIDLPAVHFITSGARVPAPPAQIRLLQNAAGDEQWTPGKDPVFEAELWDGGQLSGKLDELVLPVRSSDAVSQVPVHDVLEVHVPTPTVSDAMRSRIAELIRDLGHSEYAKRDAASEALGELGHLAKLQLNETLRQTSDPEVRRRVEALLEDLPD